jgi:hypothetical protein
MAQPAVMTNGAVVLAAARSSDLMSLFRKGTSFKTDAWQELPWKEVADHQMGRGDEVEAGEDFAPNAGDDESDDESINVSVGGDTTMQEKPHAYPVQQHEYPPDILRNISEIYTEAWKIGWKPEWKKTIEKVQADIKRINQAQTASHSLPEWQHRPMLELIHSSLEVIYGYIQTLDTVKRPEGQLQKMYNQAVSMMKMSHQHGIPWWRACSAEWLEVLLGRLRDGTDEVDEDILRIINEYHQMLRDSQKPGAQLNQPDGSGGVVNPPQSKNIAAEQASANAAPSLTPGTGMQTQAVVFQSEPLVGEEEDSNVINDDGTCELGRIVHVRKLGGARSGHRVILDVGVEEAPTYIIVPGSAFSRHILDDFLKRNLSVVKPAPATITGQITFIDVVTVAQKPGATQSPITYFLIKVVNGDVEEERHWLPKAEILRQKLQSAKQLPGFTKIRLEKKSNNLKRLAEARKKQLHPQTAKPLDKKTHSPCPWLFNKDVSSLEV